MDFEMYSGNTKHLVITVYDYDTNAPISLTMASDIQFQVFAPGAAEPVVTKVLGNGISITSADGGVYTVVLSTEDTKRVGGEYQYESQVLDSEGNLETVLTGTINIVRRKITEVRGGAVASGTAAIVMTNL